MATKTWLGTISTDINVGGNWSGGTKPSSGDSVLLNRDTERPMVENLATFTADTWALLYIGEDSAYGVEGAGLDVTITKLVNKSPTAGVRVVATVTEAIIDSSLPLDQVAFEAIGATVTTLTAVKGQSVLDVDTSITDLNVSYRTNKLTDALVIVDCSSGPVNQYQVGGVVVTKRDAGYKLWMSNGKSIFAPSSGGSLSEAYIGGGTVEYDIADTITILVAFAGIVNTTNVTDTLTITNLVLLPNATVLDSADLVTVTNLYDLLGEAIDV